MKVSKIIKINEGLTELVKTNIMSKKEQEAILYKCGLEKSPKDKNSWILDENTIITFVDEND